MLGYVILQQKVLMVTSSTLEHPKFIGDGNTVTALSDTLKVRAAAVTPQVTGEFTLLLPQNQISIFVAEGGILTNRNKWSCFDLKFHKAGSDSLQPGMLCLTCTVYSPALAGINDAAFPALVMSCIPSSNAPIVIGSPACHCAPIPGWYLPQLATPVQFQINKTWVI